MTPHNPPPPTPKHQPAPADHHPAGHHHNNTDHHTNATDDAATGHHNNNHHHHNSAAADNPPSSPGHRPQYEVHAAGDDAWTLTVHLPGVGKDTLDITDHDGVLHIRGTRAWRPPPGWTTLHRETTDRPFELELHHDNTIDVEKIRACLTDGELHATLPKAESRKPRKIAVS
ncbi:MAG: Hsp20/alpha crystallin family protein [Opitutaceae bacterium]|jgi:HSP20 family molecular chaperone IbpA|nr:Hsp20/alpha crystallin family protein [Opitutaceae bacterium]